MTAGRILVVNADDLGMTAAVNAGIVAAFERGIVTSASLMVRQGAAAAAAARAREHPRLAVGLHVDLGRWDYEKGRGSAGHEPSDQWDPAALERECRAQLAAFRELTGRTPTHLDSHKHVHMPEPAASAVGRLAAELGVPLRGRGVRYEGGFYGRRRGGEPFPGGISVEALVGIIRALPPGPTEIGCHPGLEMRGESSYAEERPRELQTLCNPGVREAIAEEGIRLVSFAQLS